MMCIWLKYCPSSSKKWFSRTLAFDLNLSQVAINLGRIWWKHLFWQLLPNFCHPAHPASGSTANPDPNFIHGMCQNCHRRSCSRNCFATFGVLIGNLSESRNTSVESLKVRPLAVTQKLISNGNKRVFEVERECEFSFSSFSPDNNVWCPQVSFPRVCPPIQHRDPISQQMSWCRPISF